MGCLSLLSCTPRTVEQEQMNSPTSEHVVHAVTGVNFFIFNWTSPVHPVFLLLSTPPSTHTSLKPLFFSRLTQKEKKERSGEAFGGWALQKQQPWWAQACSSVIVNNMTNCEKTRRHKSPLQWNFISCGCSHTIRWRQGVDAESGGCSWHRIDLSVCVRVCGCIGLSVCH